MTTKLIKASLYFNLIVLAIILSGCGPQTYSKRYYKLDVAHPAGSVATSSTVILDVRRFTSDSPFNSKGLIYRKSQVEYELDFYNEFLVSPGAMVTEKTRNWLSQSGLFARVLDAGSYAKPTHTLEGNITALYGDVRDRSSPAAVMEIRVFLIVNKAPRESIILGKTYRASSGLKTKSAEGLVEAFDNCLETILTDLQHDLEENL